MQNKSQFSTMNNRIGVKTVKRLSVLLIVLFMFGSGAMAQFRLHGMYLQWGYNTEWYTNSTLHFKGAVNGVPHDFKAYNAKGVDQNDLDAILKKPLQISIPQYNYRVGFYLNKEKTKAIELNFDHTKYIVKDNQRLRIKGTIGDKAFDQDTTVGHDGLFRFEHTNGANFYHINYVQFWPMNRTNRKAGYFVPMIKLGAGFMIPKTDVMISGKRLDNKFHLAGYMASVEGGAKYYIFRKFFVEATAKTGWANYTNALTVDGGKASHSFGYFELIGTIGYDINW
ncbi:hypothetical protein HHL16_03140 [Pseudoflavitalea sp. G-6-1-2]|uniref:hypothetical protein n=1 Tax=Pseudoflavitalea sp. G-6-1-2 TaxID=2728841 RepID=UPI00146BBC0D|nr:hypothetical protein [Pseudoflavitalea sp. G-6-1-2]NML19849.1 hypothetical protein [Pseudoflavitalea sp. G-6-1-2]